jgi:uncharacterized oligopeptide transporter (OPT) family protein
MSQTVASASTSLATGTIFTIPALFLWGVVPPYLQVVALAFLGALLGIAAMVPLRRLLIVKAHDELPYPEGTACAEVLRATAASRAAARERERLDLPRHGGGRGGQSADLARCTWCPARSAAALPVLPKAELALEVAPALIGVGYILGYRQAAVCVAGALISARRDHAAHRVAGRLDDAPLYPETSASSLGHGRGATSGRRYVRYIGAGAVATAGILTVLRGLPTMADAFGRGARHAGSARSGAAPGAHRPRPAGRLRFWWRRARGADGGPGARRVRGRDDAVQRAILACGVGVFGVLFVDGRGAHRRHRGRVVAAHLRASRSSRCSARRRSSLPRAGRIPGARAGVLTVGTIVAVAASKAGDISQDLKTGWLVGATPGAPAAGPAHRRGLRLLGGGRDGDAAR